MKVCFVTDTHFGVRGNSKIFLDKAERFYSEVMFPELQRQGIDTIVHLGDLWDDRKNLNIQTLNRTREIFLDRLEEFGIQMHLVIGNHDTYFRNSNDVNSLRFLTDLSKNVILVEETKVIDIGVPFGLVSWINNANLESRLKAIEDMKNEGVQYLGGHFEIKGFELTPGNPSEHGMEPKLFKGFKRVVSGHFHVRSKIGNIQYLGSAQQFNWGDSSQQRGFHIFDSETGEFEFYPDPKPMFLEKTWGDVDLSPETFKEVFGRLVIPDGVEVPRAELELFVSAAQENSYGLQVIERDLTAADTFLEATENMNTLAIIEGYLTEAIGDSGLDLTRLKKEFIDLYNESALKMEVE